MENGDDLRVFYQKNRDCKATEIDRILENPGTTNTTVKFMLQDEIGENVTETSTYILACGNADAGPAKQNPANVYLFYDDFSKDDLEDKWVKSVESATTEVVEGELVVKTDKTPVPSHIQVSVIIVLFRI